MNPYDLIELCKDKNIWIQTHNFPDTDALSSAFALQELLSHFGIEARLCHEGEIALLSNRRMIEMLNIRINSYGEIINEMSETDVIILVDCQKNSGNTDDFIGEELAVIDHHPDLNGAGYRYKDIRTVGACATIIAGYFKKLEIIPSKDAATALIMGIKSDTNGFMRGVTEIDLDIIGYLFNYYDKDRLTRIETNNLSIDDLKAYQMAINNIKIHGMVAFSHVELQCPDALVAMLADFLLSLVEVDVVVLYSRKNNGYKFSLRSERAEVDVGKLARIALEGWGNGGGHSYMAGGYIPDEKIDVSSEQFFDKIQEHFIGILSELHPHVLGEL